MSDKKVIFTVDDILFYEDMTYRCPHWIEGDYSEWNTDGGYCFFKHTFHCKFRKMWDGDESKHKIFMEHYNNFINSELEKALKFGE